MTTREQAIQWWNNLGDNFFEKIQLKQELTDKYFPAKNFGWLTDNEIEEIWRKENVTTAERLDEIMDEIFEENIYLNRLKEQYKHFLNPSNGDEYFKRKDYYQAMRLFCLDTQLISFNDIELMESEVNTSF